MRTAACLPRPLVLFAAGLLALGIVGACERKGVRRYEVPKDGPSLGPAPVSSQPATMPRGGTIAWELPEGWREVPNPNTMRAATFHAGEGEATLEVAITVLGGGGGGALPNVNRWRGQLGLGPIDAEKLRETAEFFDAGPLTGLIVDIASPPTTDEQHPARRMLAAIILADKRAYFAKATNRPEVIAAHRESFGRFVRSFHLEGRAAPMAGHPPVDGATAAAEPQQFTWQLPDGWEAKEKPGAMLEAEFWVGEGGSKVRISVSRLGGNAGGALPNINRWRNQVGLPAVGELGEQPMTAIEVDGKAAQWVDLVGESPGYDESAQRLVVVTASRSTQTWFFKMTGPDTTVEQQQASFRRFLASVRLPDKRNP